MNPHQASSPSAEAAWTPGDLARNPHDTPDKAQRVQRMFGAIAGRYDLNNRLHSLGRDQAWRRMAVKLAEVGPEDDVLDVACGTGDLTELFASARPRSVVGLDFTPEMLGIAQEKSAKRHSAESGQREQRDQRGCLAPRYMQGDAMDLPFEGDSFDIVSIAFGLRNVAQPARALAEFRRVLRPGGRLVVLEFSEPRFPPMRWLNAIYCRRIMPITATLIARDRSGAYRYLPKSVETFLSVEDLAAAMRAAGFESVSSRPMTFGICAVTVGC